MRTKRLARLTGVGAIALAATALALPAWAQSGRPGPQSAQVARGARAIHATMTASTPSPSLATDIAEARQATAKYATNLGRAKAAGYQIITMMMPDMGYHFLNPRIQGFNVRKPQILVYEHTGTGWQLGALEWVFTSEPKTPPLPNATFGFFPAACHYKDGTFIPHNNAATCPKRAPGSNAAFFFWHPNLVTMHVWVWYPNPDGLYGSTNPLVAPYDKG
jgi:hypothetical protein